MRDGRAVYTAVANPAVPHTTGNRYFLASSDGVVYYTTSAPFEVKPGDPLPAHAFEVGK